MAIKLKGYALPPRIAKVCTSASSFASYEDELAEKALVKGNAITFISDGMTFELQSGMPMSGMTTLHDGDVISINARGVLQFLFCAGDHSATVFITGKCNSNCVMCPCSDRERQINDGMDNKSLIAYIRMLPRDIRHIVVTGGEPTLKADQFFLAMKLIAERFPNAEVLLLTNGRSFASQAMLCRLLENCPPYLTVGVPIHGSNEQLHDAITQVPSSLRQTSLGIKHLLQLRVSVEMRIVVSKLNYQDLLSIASRIVQEYASVSSVKFMGLEVLGSCAANYDTCYIGLEESWQYVQPAVEQLLSAGIPVELYNYPLCMVARGYWSLCRRSITPSKVRYAKDCGLCKLRRQCCGFFVSTLRKARPPVHPVSKEGAEASYA